VAGLRCQYSKEIMLRVYRDKLVGPAPEFPAQIEQRISDYLKGDSVSPPDLSNPPAPVSAGFARGSEVSQGRQNGPLLDSNISTWPMIESFHQH